MQTLGGDPQAAYLAVLCTSGYAAGLAVAGSPAKAPPDHLPGRGSGHRLRRASCLEPLGRTSGPWKGASWWPRPRGWLSCVGSWRAEQSSCDGGESGPGGAEARSCWDWLHRPLAIAIAGVQVLPSLEFISQSPREEPPRLSASVYDQSLHPVRASRGIWPGFFGTIARGNRRWVQALPPTYDHHGVDGVDLPGWIHRVPRPCGSRPEASAKLSRLADRRCDRGPGRVARQLRQPPLLARSIPRLQSFLGTHASSSEGWPDPSATPDGVGGPYWFMTVALPGFGSFRYPGKLLVIASLGLCGLAGLGWDELRRRLAPELVAGVPSILASLSAAICIALPPTHAAFVGFLKRIRR